MSLSVGYLTLNAPANISSLSAYPAPQAPDLYDCFAKNEAWHLFPKAPAIADCKAALKLLPKGTQAEPWFPSPGEGRENVLPIKVQSGMQGPFTYQSTKAAN